MDEVNTLTSVPDHPLLHILSFLNYSDLVAYVRYVRAHTHFICPNVMKLYSFIWSLKTSNRIKLCKI